MILTKQQRIEYLCEQEIPDYAIVKPGREFSLVALSLGNNPRRIDADDKARILEAADALRADLSVKTDAEISTMFDGAKAKEWRGKHLTIVEAAQTIADKLFPVDPYDWTPGQRADCADSYQAHLKTFVLRNGVAFISPHDQKPFDLSRLSAVNFPADGLIRAADLHLCLRESDPNNGHFPVPPKPVSKAPPPITPLTLTSSRSYSRREMESAPDEQLPLTASALAPSLAAWEAKDLWSAGEFAILLCGAEPGNRKTRLSNKAIENAVRAIELAVAVESLIVAHLEQDPRDWSTFSAPATVRYFRPADAITWANRRRAEFPSFPLFAVAGLDPAPSSVAPLGPEAKAAGKIATAPKSSHVATQEQIIGAFQCRADLFANGHKFKWFVEARTKGVGGKKSIAPTYDPVAFANHLPGTTYGGAWTEKDTWKALKRHFPEQYDQVASYDPNLSE